MKRSFVLAAGLAIGAGAAFAENVAPGDVSFGEYGSIEQSLTGVPGDVANGEVIMTNRGKGNCISCHEVTALAEYPFHGEVGPILDGAADRWTEADLRGIIVNAKMTFPESVMPAFYKVDGFIRPGDGYTTKPAPDDLAPILSAQEIEDVVAYLMTLSDG